MTKYAIELPEGRSPLSGYLPTLDGWRAVAVLLVIVYHAQESLVRAYGDSATGLHAWLKYGWVGVSIFFGISGILITSRLLEEEQVRGKINLGEFYIRRACRILPPLLLLLVVLATMGIAGWLPVRMIDWFRALLFGSNYGPLPGWYLAHTWSLSVEEHFYVIWPALLVLLGFKRGLVFCLVVVMLMTVWRVADIHWSIVPARFGTSPWRTDTTSDGLLLGAAVACAMQLKEPRRVAVGLAERTWVAPVLMLALALVLVAWSTWGSLQHPMRALLVALIPLLLLATILGARTPVSRVLEWKPLRWIGRISYSLYLWQQVFLVPDHALAKSLGALQAWPYNLGAIVVCSLGSYYLVERPFIALGHRLAKPASEGRI